MSNGNSGFGSKVIGHEAAEAAIRNEQGGGNVFGVRVRGAISGSGPTNDAKRVSEFGVGVIDGAHASNAQGEQGDTVSVDDLRNILAENPTFFDSLYEAELAREDGPRDDALGIFYEVERGIKGQMRADVMSEIRSLLGQTSIDADALANQVAVRREAQAGMQKRTEENRLLADADRVKSLVERNENVKRVRQQQESGDLDVQVGLSTESQEARIASDRGLAMPGAEQATGSSGASGTPAKPDGDTNVETQQPGERLLVPKGTADTSESGSSSNGTRPAAGASSTDSTSGSASDADADQAKAKLDAKIEEIEGMTKGDLEDFLGDEAPSEGTGANGAVVKDDLVKAAKRKARADAKR